MRGLIIRQPWIDYTLNGFKAFEVRGGSINIRGRIGLICAGTSEVWGEADVIDSYVCIEDIWLRDSVSQIREELKSYVKTQNKLLYIWELDNIVRYDKPRKYKHPQGAQTWVKEIEFIKE